MSWTEITGYLAVRMGFNPEAVPLNTMRLAVTERMNLLGLEDLTAYLDFLRCNRQEFSSLIELLIVPETWFFRDKAAFNYLQDHISGIRANITDRNPVKILSVPCSTGEEPYSIVMTLLEAGLEMGQFIVDAVDISQSALDKARAAVYSRNSFRGDEAGFLARYFVKSGKERVLSPDLIRLVNFTQGNILDYKSLDLHAPYHIIFCRNLLIYLSEEARATTVEHLDRLLLDQGLVFLGFAETRQHFFPEYEPIQHPRVYAACKRLRRKSRKAAPVLLQPSIRSDGPGQIVQTLQPGRVLNPGSGIPGSSDPDQNAALKQDNLKPEKVPALIEDDLGQARRLADAGQLVEAAGICRRILNQDAVDPEVHFLSGVIALALGEDREAIESFQRVIYLKPGHVEALAHMAWLMDKEGRSAQAERYRRRMARLVQQAGPGSEDNVRSQ